VPSASQQCDECRTILEAFRVALSEIRGSPKLEAELRAWGRMLLTLGTEQGADEASRTFPFRVQPQERLGAHNGDYVAKFPKIASVFRQLYKHYSRTGHNVLLSEIGQK
jgi:hypothetical protein